MIKYPDALVRRTNELFYNLGGKTYDYSHDEITVLEVPRWKKIADIFLRDSAGKRVVMDIGCGTGFVPGVICPYLKPGDEMVCADISAGVLEQCRAKLEKTKFGCKLSFKLYDGIRIPMEDGSVDVLTMNSVLHHIPDTAFFLKEVRRVLKDGGYFVIGHEANGLYYDNRIIWTIYRVLYVLYNPRSVFDILRKRGFLSENQADPGAKKNEDAVTAEINDTLIAEGLIKDRLSRLKIDNIVEYYNIRGFTPEDINRHLDFNLVLFETYNHLYWIYAKHYRNPFIAVLDRFLGFLYPAGGKNMFLVFKKNQHGKK